MTLTTNERSRLRRTLERYVDEAPPAPEWGTWEEPLLAPSPKRPGRAWAAATAAVVAILAIGGIVYLASGTGSNVVDGGDPLAHDPGEYPRLIIDLPGWEVVRVHEDATGAEYDHRSPQAEATLRIEAGDQQALVDLIADRRASAADSLSTTMFGYPATMTRYADSAEWAVMWQAGDLVYEFRTEPFETATSVQRLLTALTPTEAASWRAALGDNVVTPERVSSVVAEMMRDIPLPADFQPSRMRYDNGVQIFGVRLFLDRYQLGAEVAGAATCAWVEQWLQADAAGDEEALLEATEAMATSSDWAILQEMNPAGDYPEAVWETAAAMKTDGVLFPDTPALGWTLANWTNDALGCPSLYPPPTP